MGEPVLDFGVGFKSVAERLPGEREERLQRGKRLLSFGVSFLDHALGGIFPNDLIVIGAKTGVGKTALSTIIAHENVKRGKRVHYFALEAEEREIERRMKYRAVTETLYRDLVAREQKARLNYIDWYSGKIDDISGGLVDARADKEIGDKYSSLHTYYRAGGFDIDELQRLVLAIQDQTDLIVLDHLHYVDTADPNENRGVKEIVKRIRDVSLNLGKPVIVVAHLRKNDRASKSIVPDIDDFHGTSDITKIATKCILLAPARDQPTEFAHVWNTYMHCPKCRMDGSRTRYIALIPFNARCASYEPEYQLARATGAVEKFEPLKINEYPEWANP